jgi:hypothetical protein
MGVPQLARPSASPSRFTTRSGRSAPDGTTTVSVASFGSSSVTFARASFARSGSFARWAADAAPLNVTHALATWPFFS